MNVCHGDSLPTQFIVHCFDLLLLNRHNHTSLRIQSKRIRIQMGNVVISSENEFVFRLLSMRDSDLVTSSGCNATVLIKYLSNIRFMRQQRCIRFFHLHIFCRPSDCDDHFLHCISAFETENNGRKKNEREKL